MREDRWPPVYDADDLAREIQVLTERPDFETAFYEWRLDRGTQSPVDVCQGDVVTLASEVPAIGEDGQPGYRSEPHRNVVGARQHVRLRPGRDGLSVDSDGTTRRLERAKCRPRPKRRASALHAISALLRTALVGRCRKSLARG